MESYSIKLCYIVFLKVIKIVLGVHENYCVSIVHKILLLFSTIFAKVEQPPINFQYGIIERKLK